MSWLIVGLGNPGPKYAGNRHNVGFHVVERLSERWGALSFREKFGGRYAKVAVGGEDAVLLEPLEFMNHSGVATQKAMRFFDVALEQVVVVHDELDLPYGRLRLKKGGGTAGHNGLRSIVQHCGGPDYLRLRFGIGRPEHGNVRGWVLGDFGAEAPNHGDRLDAAADFVTDLVKLGAQAAMREHHPKS